MLDILDQIAEEMRTAVRNNGGGHANHALFWETMSPEGGGEPDGALATAIDDAFDGLAELKRQMTDAGLKRFGSGWAWLVHDGTGLVVVSTPNQDTPLMDGHTPLLGVDVWEHAYYLRYQNRRADYLEAWWNVVNWATSCAATRAGPRLTRRGRPVRGRSHAPAVGVARRAAQRRSSVRAPGSRQT